MSSVTVGEAYREAKKRLEQAGVEDAAFDAACLLEKDTGVPRARLPLLPGRGAVACRGLGDFQRDVARRAAGEPLQYILGEWEFFGRPFFVGPGVLIPRPETELLARTAAAFLAARGKSPRLLELCAGSGCGMLSVLLETPGSRAVGLEISPEAAGWCRRNIRRYGLEERAALRMGDMLAPRVPETIAGTFDCLICNPPYIPSDEIPRLQREVRREPRLALDGGPDGLRFYRALSGWVPKIAPGGLLTVEVGAGEAAAVAAMGRQWGLTQVEIHRDLAGIERVVAGRRPA